MKALILGASITVALAGFSVQATAGCSTGRVLEPGTLRTLLQGNTVCVPVVTVATMDWQELHQAGGDLVDYKRGPGHPVDPSEKVGTWRITGDVGSSGDGAYVTHAYTGGSSYTYKVYNNGDGTYSFCGGNPADIKARIKTGGGAC